MVTTSIACPGWQSGRARPSWNRNWTVGPNWDSFPLHQELSNLGLGGRYLIHGGTEEAWNKVQVPTSVLLNYRLQNGGKLLHTALGLVDIPTEELNEVIGRLREPQSS
jgi:hypothetical protein